MVLPAILALNEINSNFVILGRSNHVFIIPQSQHTDALTGRSELELPLRELE